VSVTENAAGSPQKASLRGFGTTAKLSPTSLGFGNVIVGSTSPPQLVTLSNVGTTASVSAASRLPGPDFAQTHTCGSSLAAADGHRNVPPALTVTDGPAVPREIGTGVHAHPPSLSLWCADRFSFSAEFVPTQALRVPRDSPRNRHVFVRVPPSSFVDL
jgi:hypothetical protein